MKKTTEKCIVVDGIIRPIHDTNGRIVANDIDGQVAFWRFYQEGPLDDKGRPIVVYHGCCGFEGEEFSYKFKGHNSYSDADIGFFFGSAEVANCFAGDLDENGAIVPAYLSLQNPKYVQGMNFVAMLENLDFDGWKKFKHIALRSGYDGVIVRTDEEARCSEFHHQFQSDNYIAFFPEQIKSAIGNPGTFNKNTASITDGRSSKIGENLDLTHEHEDEQQNESIKKRYRP